MQIPQKKPSLIDKGLNWIANHTYRKIPSIINSYQRKVIQPKKLSFQDYILNPQLAREAGLLYVRQLRKDYIKQKQGIQRVISQFKSNTDLMKQKPHELLCPICLQLFSGPVTTSCNHTFCRMCLDESILFNPNCPTCRKNIRGQQLIVSKATEAIIRMILYKLQIDEVEKFVKKQLEYQEWLQKRTPKREALHKSQLIDVRDTEHIWCKGKIIEVLPLNASDPSKYEYLLVHYEGWASRFDEVISLDSLRLATSQFYMSRYEIPHYNLDPNNHEHYRCPVVTGPPQPVVPIVDDIIEFIEQPEIQEEMFEDQQNIEENEDLSFDQSEFNDPILTNSEHEASNIQIEYNVIQDQNSEYELNLNEIVLNYSQQIYAHSEPNNHTMNNLYQEIQLLRDMEQENIHHWHIHSQPQQRIMRDLVESDFELNVNGNLRDENHPYINGQVDQQIFCQVNQQLIQQQLTSSQKIPQNPEQNSKQKVLLPNKMNERESQIQQVHQGKEQNENENNLQCWVVQA